MSQPRENGEIGNPVTLAALRLQARLVVSAIPPSLSPRGMSSILVNPPWYLSGSVLMSAAHTVSEK